MTLDIMFAIVKGLAKRFPKGNDPYQSLARLLEECGELAQQVNLFEGAGVKDAKYGKPDKQKLAKEVQDVIRGALQIAVYYGIEEEIAMSFESSYNALREEGYIS
jgi:NTP pyrophosphatase (non-canonical NTP hydrolase)